VCIGNLRRMCEPLELVVTPAIVCHRETVTVSGVSGMCKTANKHNRFYFTASPLAPELIAEFESGSLPTDATLRARRLVEVHGWDRGHARKILAMSGPNEGPNVLVDSSVGVQYMPEVTDHLVAAFHKVCSEGPLCGERVRGVRFDIIDAKIHADGAQRRSAQVVPACVRALQGVLLLAEPALFEPIYRAEIQVPQTEMGSVNRVMAGRRGTIHTFSDGIGGQCTVQGHLPVAESSGFTEELRQMTHGKAFPTCTFSHWAMCTDSVLVDGVKAIRDRKGLGAPLTSDDLLDKL